jgi:hypothetical protein
MPRPCIGKLLEAWTNETPAHTARVFGVFLYHLYAKLPIL